MRGRSFVAIIAGVAFAVVATPSCGALLPSSGEDDPPPSNGATPSGSPFADGGDGGTGGMFTVPVDPTVDDPPDAARPDASSDPEAGGGGDGGTPVLGPQTWSCETKTRGPFSSLDVCEAARSQICDQPDVDVADGKPCPRVFERHESCGACGAKNSFNSRECTCVRTGL